MIPNNYKCATASGGLAPRCVGSHRKTQVDAPCAALWVAPASSRTAHRGWRALARFAVTLALLTPFSPTKALAQDQKSDDEGKPATVFKHDVNASWWVGGQMNFIFQANPALPSAYEGPNSFGPDAGRALSRVLTLFTALRLNETTDIVVDLESAGGSGLNNGAGLGGPPNLDVVRNPTLSSGVYLARATIRHIFALSEEAQHVETGATSAVASLPARRVEIRAGKFGTVDYFDVNAVGSDSHLQFMNWAVDNDGAFDYAADTRGYTIGVLAEYDAPRWAFRFSEALMPTTANGIVLDSDLVHARGESAEVELHRGLLPGRDGRIRVLGYVNHANMGTYSSAIAAFQAGRTSHPDIVTTRKPGTVKYGAGLNIEQAVAHGVRAFARAGWNDGRTESFAYTEIDRTVSAGADSTGERWHRPADKIGAAFVVSGLSAEHREYLALGGHGFQLGDGRLSYGHEQILEMYYTVPLVRGVFASADLQRIVNPGFNRDRGPVIVGTLRLHVDF